MAERDAPRTPPAREIAGDDFLFHLYRGSELLQDNRVHEAKGELEQALSLQPSDPKGQDLLGIVYFRLGLYPRAIAIYEQLIKIHPEAIEPRINLSLCYLKTGQPAQARFELEKVVDQNPGHSRAWGYLGLAFQRLGDYERASYAFAAGGHDGMARRLIEMAASGGALSVRPEQPASLQNEARKAAGEALGELERGGDVPFRPPEETPAAEGSPATNAGAWTAIEPGRERVAPPPPRVPTLASSPELAETMIGVGSVAAVAPPAPPSARIPLGPPSVPRRPPVSAPRRAVDVVRDTLIVFPRDLPVSKHTSGAVLVQATSGFVTRLEAIRSMSYAAGATSSVTPRRARGRTLEEPLGGAASPLVEISGRGELVLGPAMGHILELFLLEEDPLYLCEEALVGFEPGVAHENGRLPVGDGEAIGMVQLRGPGVVVASLPQGVRAIEITDLRTAAIRAIAVLGWVGRVVPRSLPASETPAGVRGLVAFAGEGMVLVDGR
jgi:uncharacterized protein (AIM24 family)